MKVEVELKTDQDNTLPPGTRAIHSKASNTVHIFNPYGGHVCWISEGSIGNYSNSEKFPLEYFRKWGHWEPIDIEKIVVRKEGI